MRHPKNLGVIASLQSDRIEGWAVDDSIGLFVDQGTVRIVDLYPWRLEVSGQISINQQFGQIIFATEGWEAAYGGKPVISPGIYQYDMRAKKLFRIADGCGASFSPSGDLLAYASRRKLTMERYPSREAVAQVDLPPLSKVVGTGWIISWLPDGKIVVGNRLKACVVDIDSGTVAYTDKGIVRYSPDGSMEASTRTRREGNERESRLIVKDVESGETLADFPEHTRHGRWIEFKWGSDGRLYIARTTDCMWNVLFGFSRTGTRILCWDPSSRRTYKIFEPGEYMSTFAIVPEELANEIATAHGDGGTAEEGAVIPAEDPVLRPNKN